MKAPERAALFSRGLAAIRSLEAVYPEFQPLISIRNQLQFLLSQTGGATPNREALAQINIGYLTARTVECRNELIAAVLYECSAEVKSMLSRPKLEGGKTLV